MRNIALLISILALMAACAQKETKTTFEYTGNPLVKDKFTADPAPLVHEGTLYSS